MKIWPQINVMTWSEKDILHISRSVSSAWTQLLCFHCSSWSLLKVIAEKTVGDLSWPEMTLAAWRRVTGRNIPTQGVKYTCNTMFERVLNGFCSRDAPFILSHNGEVAKLPDLKSPISKFRDIRLIDTVMDINRWKLQGVRSFSVVMTSIETFSEVWGHLTWPQTCWPDLEWPGSEIFTKCAEKIMLSFILDICENLKVCVHRRVRYIP